MRKHMYICLVCLVLFSGCANKSSVQNSDMQDSTSFSDNSIDMSDISEIFGPYSVDNATADIYDIDNEIIGQLEYYGDAKLLNDSIFYSKIPDAPVSEFTALDFYLYNIKSGESTKLGTVENWSYSSIFNTVVNDDHLYMYVSTGSYDDNDLEVLIYDVDLEKCEMTEILSVPDGYMYSPIHICNDKLLYIDITFSGKNSLKEYDISQKEWNTILEFDYNRDTHIGDSPRQITSDGNNIYLLRLACKSWEEITAYVDVYDFSYSLQDSIDITSLFLSECINEDISQEIRQPVAYFDVLNNYIYYQNFSTTTFFGRIDGVTRSIMNTGPHFQRAHDLIPCSESVLYFMSYHTESSMYTEGNDLFLLKPNDNKMQKATFYAGDSRYYFICASKCDDNVLLTMAYKDPDTAETLPTRLYYINIADLNFSDYTPIDDDWERENL